jgi:hypothetical protein
MMLTAVVTAPPSELKRPALKPGETLIQFYIRNNAEEWRTEVERMAQKFRLAPAMANALRSGKVDAVPAVQAEIHRLVNDYTPRPLRTIRGLGELKTALGQLPQHRQFQFEILYPRQSSASAEMSPEALEKFGATAITLESINGSINPLLSHVKGDLLWIVPGATKVVAANTVEKIERMVNYFDANSAAALYHDGLYSMILRTSACQKMAEQGQALPTNAEKLAQAIRAAGHKASRDSNKEDALCTLESEFGGPAKPADAQPAKSWWKSMFAN